MDCQTAAIYPTSLPANHHDFLAEDTKLMTQTIANHRYIQRGERIKKARSQSTQSAVTQTRLRFLSGDGFQVEPPGS